jgi:hypothetical protein
MKTPNEVYNARRDMLEASHDRAIPGARLAAIDQRRRDDAAERERCTIRAALLFWQRSDHPAGLIGVASGGGKWLPLSREEVLDLSERIPAPTPRDTATLAHQHNDKRTPVTDLDIPYHRHDDPLMQELQYRRNETDGE